MSATCVFEFRRIVFVLLIFLVFWYNMIRESLPPHLWITVKIKEMSGWQTCHFVLLVICSEGERTQPKISLPFVSQHD